MKNLRATALVLAAACVIAAGCMVTDQARYHEPGGGTGVRIIDVPLDAFTTLEGNIAGAVHSGIKSSDTAVADAYHFTTGIVRSAPGPSLGAMQRARRRDAKRRVSRPDIIEKVEKAKITVDAPILDRQLLDKLGMYLVWDTPLADVKVRNAWVMGGLILLETKDTATKDYKLFAVDLHNGFARWMYRFLSPLDSRPTLDGNTLWTSSVSKIYPIEIGAGSAPWPTRVEFTVSSPFCVVGNKLYVGTFEHAVYGLTKGDKYSDWDFGTFAPITATPVVEGKVLYAASEDGSLYAFNFAGNDNLWQVRTNKPIVADMAHDDNNIYFGSEDFDLYCVSKSTGTVLWKFPTQGPITRAVRFLDNETLLVKGEGSALYALDMLEGTEKWSDPDALYPVARGRFLYVLTENNTIKALDLETGEAQWEQSAQPFKFVPPNLATDAITLCTKDGQMFLIQEKSGMSLRPEDILARAEPERPKEPEKLEE